MTQALINIRRAMPGDADQIAAVHDEAWREAYRASFQAGSRTVDRPPGAGLVAARGGPWSRLLVFSLHGKIGGYVSYGRNRAPSMEFDGEIFELYLTPEYQGRGLAWAVSRRMRRSFSQRADHHARLDAQR